jgi:RNA polymerase sigma factor (sigma-70 family)
MIESKTLEHFIANNHDDLLRIIKSFGIHDRDQVHDLSQGFYIRLQTILDKFDPSRSKFSSYIYQCIHNYAESERTKDKLRTTCQINDSMPSPIKIDMLGVRIQDFRAHAQRRGYHGVAKVLQELDLRLADSTVSCCFSGTYRQYLNRFLIDEIL